MGNNHSEEELNSNSFLADAEAKELFGTIDYALKNGKHIQRWQAQETLFLFIDRNYISLKRYYKDFFGVLLDNAGESIQKYFFLEFLPDSRGEIPIENRHFLPNEYVIVGFMLYKIVYIDGYVELNTLSTLQKMIKQDYEDIKPGIYRALAKAKKIHTTQMDDEKADDIIEKALREFSRIAWISWDGDVFDILPSFQRLPKIYSDYINNPDLWLNKANT
ncbi:MAG TPA: hypothetical protein VF868_11775 [Bacteroidia bacterium]|jgi:chromosome condensin MukBEF MukE localization factor